MKINDNQCFISKEALSILHFKSTDDTRPILRGLLIRNGYICCCDGFTLGTYKVEQGKDFPETILNSDDVKIAGINKTTEGLTITLDSNTYILRGKYTLITEPIKGNFPETKQLFKALKPEKNLATIGLSKFVIKKLLAALQSSGTNFIALRVKHTDLKSSALANNKAAIEFTSYVSTYSTDGDLKGLIMPCVSPEGVTWYSDTLVD